LTTVVEGRRSRGLTHDRVDQIGRGHVWTGAQARAIGLVDQMGGVAAAIDLAARLGRVPRGRDALPPLTVLPRPRAGLIERLTVDASAKEGERDLLRVALSKAGALAAVRFLAPFLAGDGTGIEARLPYDLEIR
jgi:protease-4